MAGMSHSRARCLLLVCVLASLAAAAAATGTMLAVESTPTAPPTSAAAEVVLERLRGNSRPVDFAAALARLRRLLPESTVAPTGVADSAAAARLARVAAGGCGSAGMAVRRWPDADLLHSAATTCDSVHAAPMLLAVASDPARADRRANVRRTWGARRGVALAFFLGRPDSAALRVAVDAEAARFGDLVQFQLPDGPRWGTERHLATLEWALLHCPGVRHLVHLEDTVFVHVRHLTDHLAEKPPPGFLCSPRRNSKPHRGRGSRWFVSKSEFNGLKYPDYCDTIAYVVSNESAFDILACAVIRPSLWMDDVHVTGILREAAGVPLADFASGHGICQLLPRDSRDPTAASDCVFLVSEKPEFIGDYWPGLWRKMMQREFSAAMGWP